MPLCLRILAPVCRWISWIQFQVPSWVFSFYYLYCYTNHCPSLQKQTLTSFIFPCSIQKVAFYLLEATIIYFFMLFSFLSFFQYFAFSVDLHILPTFLWPDCLSVPVTCLVVQMCLLYHHSSLSWYCSEQRLTRFLPMILSKRGKPQGSGVPESQPTKALLLAQYVRKGYSNCCR